MQPLNHRKFGLAFGPNPSPHKCERHKWRPPHAEGHPRSVGDRLKGNFHSTSNGGGGKEEEEEEEVAMAGEALHAEWEIGGRVERAELGRI